MTLNPMWTRSDLVVGLLALANVTLEGVVKAIVAIGPAASVLFTITQIAVGAVTVVYIFLKAWTIIAGMRKKACPDHCEGKSKRKPRTARKTRRRKPQGKRPAKI